MSAELGHTFLLWLWLLMLSADADSHKIFLTLLFLCTLFELNIWGLGKKTV